MKTTLTRLLSSCAVLSLASLCMPACSIDAEGPEDASDEDIATAESALWETTCETAPKNADGVWGSETISAGNAYGSTGCPDQFLVGWGGLTNPHNASAHVHYEGATLSQSECNNAHMSIACFSETSGIWTRTSAELFDGAWIGGSCSFSVRLGGDLNCNLPGDQKNRTAAEAWVRHCDGMGNCNNDDKRKVGIDAIIIN